MPGRIPEIVVLTTNVEVAHAVTVAATEEWTEWHQGFGAALGAIRPDTKVLVVDGAMDAPLARLLPSLFVENRPGRRAIVLQPEGASTCAIPDERVTVLPWPQRLQALADAIAIESPADAPVPAFEVALG